jgi:hypothetical protein
MGRAVSSAIVDGRLITSKRVLERARREPHVANVSRRSCEYEGSEIASQSIAIYFSPILNFSRQRRWQLKTLTECREAERLQPEVPTLVPRTDQAASIQGCG